MAVQAIGKQSEPAERLKALPSGHRARAGCRANVGASPAALCCPEDTDENWFLKREEVRTNANANNQKTPTGRSLVV